MHSYGIRKTIDQLGRITIPKAFRTISGMDIGDEVEICQTDNGILIRPVTDTNEEETANDD